MERIEARDRLIVALDLPDAAAARDMVNQLDGVVTFFKIGLTLQLAEGVEKLIQELLASGKRVFLDYKYYDIAETMKKTIARAAKLGVSFLTIHGSSTLVKAAVEGRGNNPLKLFTVTVLTNLEKSDIAEMGYPEQTVEELVLFRARKALEAGCDGVIASGREVEAIKKTVSKGLLVITPGIRPDGTPENDQKRVTTPAQAITAGADYLVVGRPITAPPSGTPREAAQRILVEMQGAFDSLAVRHR
jgi:orotidine-5'-phosphate decarboxylase